MQCELGKLFACQVPTKRASEPHNVNERNHLWSEILESRSPFHISGEREHLNCVCVNFTAVQSANARLWKHIKVHISPRKPAGVWRVM